MEFVRVDISEIEKLNEKLKGSARFINAVKFKDGFYYINSDMLTDPITWGGEINEYLGDCPKHQKDLSIETEYKPQNVKVK